MSTATAVEAPVPAKGKKKLILIFAVASLLTLGGGGTAAWLLKKNADAQRAEYGDEDEQTAAADAALHTSKAAPVFVPLDPFTVNLADRQADRYAQVGVTLEIDDSATGDRIKAFMPAIRNNVLMAIADRTAADLLGREGKALLAERIKRETARALGYAIDDEALDAEAGAAVADRAGKKRRSKATELPVKAVHFSTFIIQ